jgi:hypothetical protein
MAGMLLDVLTNGGNSVTTTAVPVSIAPSDGFSCASSAAFARTRNRPTLDVRGAAMRSDARMGAACAETPMRKPSDRKPTTREVIVPLNSALRCSPNELMVLINSLVDDACPHLFCLHVGRATGGPVGRLLCK